MLDEVFDVEKLLKETWDTDGCSQRKHVFDVVKMLMLADVVRGRC